jgi:hypothetical protein
MSKTLNLYEESKHLHDNYEGVYEYTKHARLPLSSKQSKKRMLNFKTTSVILQDRYLNELEDERLGNKISVVKDIVK